MEQSSIGRRKSSLALAKSIYTASKNARSPIATSLRNEKDSIYNIYI